MMFCPRCDGEFRPGFTECNQCRVALVEEPPKAREEFHGTADPVVLAAYMTLAEAAVVASLLSAYGCRVWLWNLQTLSLNWYWLPALGGVALVASSDDGEEVYQLLELARADAALEPALELAADHPIIQRRRLTKAITCLLLLSNLLFIFLLAPFILTGSHRHDPAAGADRRPSDLHE